MEKYIYKSAAGYQRRLVVAEREDGLLDVAIFSKYWLYGGSFVMERENLEEFLRKYGAERE